MTACNKDAKSAQVSRHVYMRNQLKLIIVIVGSRASGMTFTLLGTMDKTNDEYYSNKVWKLMD